MTGVRRQGRDWAALAAAFALLFHTMVAGFVDGALASPQLLDIFGNVICAAHAGEQAPDGPGQPDHRGPHLPDCCLAGCSLTGGHAVAPAPPPSLPARLAEDAHLAPPARRVVVERPERSPLNPRAPPLAG
jgi:hypothetical protein